jgi:ribosomal protein S19
MSRVTWKGPFQDIKLVKQIKQNKVKNYIKIWKRGSVITQSFIGKVVLIYNGKLFKKFYITRLHLGYKFGEFCFTRKYSVKEKKGKKKNN